MAANNEVQVVIQGKNNLGPAVAKARADLDSIIAKAKSKPLTAPIKIDINTQLATERIRDLEAKIAGLRAKVASGTISVGQVGGLQQAEGELRGLQSALGNVGVAAKPLPNLLGGISKMIGPAAIAAGVVTVGRLALELGNLGAQALVTAKSFDSVLTSVGADRSLLGELKTAAGGTITEMRLMQLTNTALAGASDELGASFAKAIPRLIEAARAANQLNPALGDTEFLFSSLVTGIKRGSPMLIDNTGITLKLGEANETYAKSIGKSASALTDEEKKLALLHGTLSGADRLIMQVGGNLDNMAASSQKVKTAWEELRTEVGKGLAPGVSSAQNEVAAGLNALTTLIQRGSNDAATQIQGLEASLAGLRREREATLSAIANGALSRTLMTPGGMSVVIPLTVDLADTDVAIAELEKQINYAKSALVDWGDAGAGAARQVHGTLPPVADAIDGVNAELAESERYWKLWEGFAVNAANNVAASVRAAWAARSAQGRDWDAATYARLNEHMGLLGGETGIAPAKAVKGSRAWNDTEAARLRGETLRRQIADSKKANTQIGKDAASAYETAMKSAAGRIQGFLSTAISASINLKDLKTDMMQPGANGPFENLFRALDVANLGGASPWAEKLGLTQEAAKKISEDFQRGIFSPDVLGLVDQGALVKEAQLAQLAEQTQTAFAEAISKKAGVGVNLVSSLFGFGGGDESGVGKDASAAKTARDAMSQVADVLGDTLKDAEFAGRIVEYGKALWGFFENGIVETAKASSSLQAAIDGLVAVALAKRGGGSVGGAAREGGF